MEKSGHIRTGKRLMKYIQAESPEWSPVWLLTKAKGTGNSLHILRKLPWISPLNTILRCKEVVISKQGKGYWSIFRQKTRSEAPKAVGCQHRQFYGNSYSQAVKKKSNTIYSFVSCRYGREKKGHAVWVTQGLHVPLTKPAPWRDHSRLNCWVNKAKIKLWRVIYWVITNNLVNLDCLLYEIPFHVEFL